MFGAPRVSLFAGTMLFAALSMAAIPDGTRALIDGLIKSKGIYVPEEGVLKFTFPRDEATIVRDDQTLSPNLALNTWVAFSGAVHKEAILRGQLLLLPDEVDPVIGSALEGGLEVTGLAESTFFPGPRLFTLEVTGVGAFGTLATAFRKTLDQIGNVRKRAESFPRTVVPARPEISTIDPRPIDGVLSMRGSVVDGVYRAGIGTRTLLRGETIGREMGMSSWVSLAGSNNQALLQGEIVATTDELQRVLKALHSKGVAINSIRNHTFGEHPQVIFVRYWAEGPAVELARVVRYVLEVQVGRAHLRPGA